MQAVNLTYDVVEKVLTDVFEMFPDELVHLGYDEINFGACTIPFPFLCVFSSRG